MHAIAKHPHDDDNYDELSTVGIEVNDLTGEVEAIDLVVVPGSGLTYNGHPTMEECMDRIDPSIRDCSPGVRHTIASFAKRVLGFGQPRG